MNSTTAPTGVAAPRLERPRDGRMISGVSAGIARHLGVDPVLVRIAFVAGTLAGGFGFLAYVAAVLLIPEEGREQLGPALRAFAWHHVLGERNGIGDSIAPNRPLVRRTLHASAPVAARIIRGDYGATAERADAMRAQIIAAADRLEAELGPGGYLVGDAFSVADLSAAALFTPVLQPPGRPYLPAGSPPAVEELREELEARETGRWVRDIYTRHRGAWQRVP